jgi:predicted TIM-barrel fold metal-dependent hydrolase
LGDYQTDGGIERIVKKFGSGNLLFGTNFPTNNMGGAIGVLSSANINTGDKEAIAHGNIERLLDEVSL